MLTAAYASEKVCLLREARVHEVDQFHCIVAVALRFLARTAQRGVDGANAIVAARFGTLVLQDENLAERGMFGG